MVHFYDQHRDALEFLLEHPKVLGIKEPIIWAAKEVKLYRADHKGLLTDIDLLYNAHSGLWVAEYKCSHQHSTIARRQLHVAERFVKEHFNQTPNLIYVWGNNFRHESVPTALTESEIKSE